MLNVDVVFASLLKNEYVASAISLGPTGDERDCFIYQENMTMHRGTETTTPLSALWIALVAALIEV